MNLDVELRALGFQGLAYVDVGRAGLLATCNTARNRHPSALLTTVMMSRANWRPLKNPYLLCASKIVPSCVGLPASCDGQFVLALS